MFISVLAERLELRDLKALLERNPDLQVILLTGRATMKQAVEAMKLGALPSLPTYVRHGARKELE